MLPFNEEFQTGESKITQIRLEVLLNNGTLLSLTEEHVMLGGLTRDSSTTVDGAFTVGAAVTGKLTVVLDNSDQSLSEYDFRAAMITASIGGQLKSGNYELIRIGIYTVDEYTYDGSTISLTAYDNFHKFDLPCSESSVTFPRTITQLITQACSLAGVTLANTSIPNGSYSVTKQPESWDTMTWHDVVSYCAQIGCCFARILPNGKLFLSWYDTSSMTGDQYDGGVFDGEPVPVWVLSYINTEEGLITLSSSRVDDNWFRIDNSIGFVFNGNSSDYLYIASNSRYQLSDSTTVPGSSTSTPYNVNICGRDGQSVSIKYQEINDPSGRAIKVRFHGYTQYATQYQTSEYELEYEIFFISSGQILINFIKIPTDTSYFGTTSIIENSITSTFTPDTSAVIVMTRNSSGGWSRGSTSTSYQTGAYLDGGDFDYIETVSADGGLFEDREDVAIIGSNFDLTVDTDDVMITGVSVLLAVANNINAAGGTQDYEKTIGTSGYVIRVENNPLIETTANADTVCAYLYDYLVGMRFRPMSASTPENPALEAGDVALVVDRYGNTYTSFLSHVTYTTNSSTQVSCDAESTMQNLKARYSEAQKTRAMAQRVFDKAITDAESAMSTIMTALATTMGLYQYTQSDGQGGTIYIYGNKNTLAASNIRWKFSAGAMMVSSDYGQTWNGAITADGIAVLQEIYAVKVNADNILTGNISIGGTSGNKNGALNIKDENGNVIATMSKSGVSVKGSITSGSTISGSTVSGTTITGGSLSGTTMSVGSGFSVDKYGKLTATEAELSGAFRSTEYSGNWVYLSGGSIQFGSTAHPGQCGINPHTYDNIITMQLNSPKLITIGNAGFDGGIYVNGPITGTGAKNRLVKGTAYGDVKLYAYETPTPYFGDIGTGCTDENGESIISIDDILDETVNANVEYSVFLQKEGQGDIWVEEKEHTYFVVKGTPGIRFSWEVKIVQKGYEDHRTNDDSIDQFVFFTEQPVGLSMDDDLNILDKEVFYDDAELDEDIPFKEVS